MKVTSNKTVHFPSLNWGINAGEERELPEDKDAQKEILAHPAVSEVKGAPAGGNRNAREGDLTDKPE